jgi:hypothetical protein
MGGQVAADTTLSTGWMICVKFYNGIKAAKRDLDPAIKTSYP